MENLKHEVKQNVTPKVELGPLLYRCRRKVAQNEM